MEIWKDIPGYEGRYQASSLGRIKSLSRPVKYRHAITGERLTRVTGDKILKHENKINGAGYYGVCLGSNNSEMVHRLVAMAFLGRPGIKSTVNHKNCNKLDNRAENLEWCSYKENINHAIENGLYKNCFRKSAARFRGEKNPKAKLSYAIAKEIRALYDSGDFTQKSLAKRYSVAQNTISLITLDKIWVPTVSKE